MYDYVEKMKVQWLPWKQKKCVVSFVRVINASQCSVKSTMTWKENYKYGSFHSVLDV